MVTGFTMGGNSSSAVIGNPMSRKNNNGKRSRRIRQQQQQQQRDQQQPPRLVLLLFSAIIMFAAVLCHWLGLVGLGTSLDDEESHNSNNSAASSSLLLSRQEWEEGLPPLQQQQQQQPSSSQKKNEIHTASIDTVVRYLNELAHKPPSQLWDMLGMENDSNNNSYGDDPFSLRELEGGKCPWSSSSTKEEKVTVDWLPSRPFNSETIAKKYRNNMQSLKRGGRTRKQMEEYDQENEVVIWYEHMSKAGGTTFCGLAQSNMMMWQVPKYHCMPRKDELMDGRVGSWPNDELVQHLIANRHAILSNEWDPFSLEKLELSSRKLDGTTPMKKKNNLGPSLLFLTTLRDPSDRLLSAYTFFAITSTKQKDNNGPSFRQWIDNNLSRIGRYRVGKKGTGFRANTARMNHIVWRYSGGKLTHLRTTEESEWESPFETAIRALSQQDLILPMDVMTKDGLGKTALQQLLGWDQFAAKGRFKGGEKKEGHVVTRGEIKNSNAREHFSKEEYRELWELNWLDNILYLWCRAVFLARLHCKDGLLES